MKTKKTKIRKLKLRWRKRIFVNLYALATELEKKLKVQGIQFSTEGYPIIPTEMLIKSIPEDILMYPLSKRHQSKAPKNTILCAYENDFESLYPL